MGKAAAILVVLLLAAGGGYFAYDRTINTPRILPKGTSVDLVLLTPLQAGREAKGAPVALLVSQDVKASDGTVVIPKGARASGTVEWSRGENMLSTLSNQPARLTVDLDSITVPNGPSVTISAASGEEETYSFTRANTGKSAVQQKLDGLMAKPETRQLLEQLNRAVNGEAVPDLDSPENRKALEAIAKDLSLENLTEALTKDAKPLTDAFSGLKAGKLAEGILFGDGMSTVFGALELLGSLDEVGNRIDRALRGRTIRALPGTPVKAYVSAEAHLRPSR